MAVVRPPWPGWLPVAPALTTGHTPSTLARLGHLPWPRSGTGSNRKAVNGGQLLALFPTLFHVLALTANIGVHSGGDLALMPLLGVLVDQLGSRAGMAGADHEVLQLGAGVGGQGVAGAPQVVEVEVVGQARLLPRLAVLAPEGRPTEGRPALADEEQALRARLREPVQVLAEVHEHELRQRDFPLPGTGLRVAGDPLTRGQLRGSALDPDRPLVQVDVLTA